MLRLGLAAVLFALVLGAGLGARPHLVAATSPGANGKIAFNSVRNGNADIFTMNPDGSGEKRLTDNPADEEQPVWSPDGTQIAFASLRDGNAEIYVMDADGNNERRITHSPGADASATWSPDGRRLTFDSDRNGALDVYVINLDGTGERNLSNNPANDSFPAWSPDGSKIVFESDRNGSADLFSMNPDGSGQAFLYGTPSNDEWRSNFSPDGSKIAFNVSGAEKSDVWTVNVDGTNPKRLTTNAAFDAWPTWTADGSQMLFMSTRDGDGEIFSMAPDGSGQKQITKNSDLDAFPSSQPLTCTIATVTSGETFTCVGGRTVRMLQADAPDIGQCGGDWAHAALQNIFLTPGRVVRLQYDATRSDGTGDLAAPIWIGNDGAPYNLSIVMVYVGLAKANVVGAGNTHLQAWASASQTWAQVAQWNMWAPGKPFNGGC